MKLRKYTISKNNIYQVLGLINKSLSSLKILNVSVLYDNKKLIDNKNIIYVIPCNDEFVFKVYPIDIEFGLNTKVYINNGNYIKIKNDHYTLEFNSVLSFSMSLLCGDYDGDILDVSILEKDINPKIIKEYVSYSLKYINNKDISISNKKALNKILYNNLNNEYGVAILSNMLDYAYYIEQKMKLMNTEDLTVEIYRYIDKILSEAEYKNLGLSWSMFIMSMDCLLTVWKYGDKLKDILKQVYPEYKFQKIIDNVDVNK